MNSKPILIPTTFKRFFRQYLELTSPFHKLRAREMDILALLCYFYYIEKSNFQREDDLWRKVFDYDTKLKIKLELGMEDYSLQNLLSSLRKKGVIMGNRISPAYLLPISATSENFTVYFKFEFSTEKTQLEAETDLAKPVLKPAKV